MELKSDKSLRYREEEKHLSFYMASIGKHKKETKSIHPNKKIENWFIVPFRKTKM